MARSRAACVMLAIALLGSAAWGWWSGGRNAANRFPATVIRAIDGDTIVVSVGAGRIEKVRILGADTPETVDPRKPVQCFGPQASAYTKHRLAPGTRVMLQTDAQVRDKYGRLLVRTTATPVDGSANDAVCKQVAEYLGIRAGRVKIASGHRARDKTLRITR